MGLDSVMLIMDWEKAFGVSFTQEEIAELSTPRHFMDLIAAKLGVADEPRGACLTQRAFHRLRSAIMHYAGVRRESVRPATPLKELIQTNRRRVWNALREGCGIQSLPGLSRFSLRAGWSSPRTVGEMAEWVVDHAAQELKRPNEPWTYSEVQAVVRSVLRESTRVDRFDDDDDIVLDLGID
jgi:hypothetical protein